MLPGLYGPVFQTGYGTEDLDRAIDLFARDHGIANRLRTPALTLRTTTGGEMSISLGRYMECPYYHDEPNSSLPVTRRIGTDQERT